MVKGVIKSLTGWQKGKIAELKLAGLGGGSGGGSGGALLGGAGGLGGAAGGLEDDSVELRAQPGFKSNLRSLLNNVFRKRGEGGGGGGPAAGAGGAGPGSDDEGAPPGGTGASFPYSCSRIERRDRRHDRSWRLALPSGLILALP